jgi:hypothetical protein
MGNINARANGGYDAVEDINGLADEKVLLTANIKILECVKIALKSVIDSTDPEEIYTVVDEQAIIYNEISNETISPSRIPNPNAEAEASAKWINDKDVDTTGEVEITGFVKFVDGKAAASAKLDALGVIIAAERKLGDSEVSAEVKAQFRVLAAEAKASANLGDLASIDAEIKAFVGARIDGSGKATVSWSGVLSEASANFFAGVEVKGEVNGRLGSDENNLSATGSFNSMLGVRATAAAGFGLSRDGFEAVAEFSAFAGAKAEAEANVTFTIAGQEVFTQKATAEVSVGIGASGKAIVVVKYNEITVNAAFSATLGVGIGASSETTINPIAITIGANELKRMAISIQEIKNRLDSNPYARLNDPMPAQVERHALRAAAKGMQEKLKKELKKVDKEITRIERAG